MTRKKIKIDRIENRSTRKATLRKRELGLFKKLQELSILCDVEVGAIVCNPKEDEPKVWPSREAVETLVARFESTPQIERKRKMVSHESYLAERIIKEKEKIKREEKKNEEKEMHLMVSHLYDGRDMNVFNLRQLEGMQNLVEKKLEKLKEMFLSPPSLPLPSPQLPTQTEEAQGLDDLYNVSFPSQFSMENIMNNQWFIEKFFHNQDFGGPSGESSSNGLPSDFLPGASGQENDDVPPPEDFDESWHDMFSP